MNNLFGYRFKDEQLREQALRHRSAGAPNNERLEFLGDSIVNLIIAEALFKAWPKLDEGALTRARAGLVRESSLAEVARELQVGAAILLGPGELKSGGHRRESILADTLEALIGAIYLDSDYATCRAAVLPWFEASISALPSGKVEKDPKSRLQEWLQARQLERPSYSLIESIGPDHNQTFLVRCELIDPLMTVQCTGASLRAAEQACAEELLNALDNA